MFDINKILTDMKESQLKKLEEINDKIKQEQSNHQSPIDLKNFSNYKKIRLFTYKFKFL